MVIVKRSQARIDKVYATAGEGIREVAARSALCARCGKALDPEAAGPVVKCAACGCSTPRMVQQGAAG